MPRERLSSLAAQSTIPSNGCCWYDRRWAGWGPCQRFSTGHERKNSPTEMFSGNNMIGWGAVQFGAQLGPKLVFRIRVEPSAEVQPLQTVVGVPVVGAGEQHLHQVEPVAEQ